MRSEASCRCSLSRTNNNTELYATILGRQAPWHVTDVQLRLKQEEIEVTVSSHVRAHRVARDPKLLGDRADRATLRMQLFTL